jgi:hypothetical protein
LLAATGPDWLGSPQHVVGGGGLALALAVAACFLGARPIVAVMLAVGATSAAEILVELAEYPLLYGNGYHPSAYYDTLSDLASTLVGAIAGAVVGALWMRAGRWPARP